MSLADSKSTEFLNQFEQEIPYTVTGELRGMLRTAQDWLDEDVEDWLDQDDDEIFEACRDAIIDELAERELEIETGEDQ